MIVLVVGVVGEENIDDNVGSVYAREGLEEETKKC